jgi:hypothetical protein
VELNEEVIELTRDLSQRLDPVEIEKGKLADHFEALAAGTSERFKAVCQFECSLDGSLDELSAAMHWNDRQPGN